MSNRNIKSLSFFKSTKVTPVVLRLDANVNEIHLRTSLHTKNALILTVVGHKCNGIEFGSTAITYSSTGANLTASQTRLNLWSFIAKKSNKM